MSDALNAVPQANYNAFVEQSAELVQPLNSDQEASLLSKLDLLHIRNNLQLLKDRCLGENMSNLRGQIEYSQ